MIDHVAIYKCMNQHFYTLNLCNVTFQLYLSKSGLKILYAHKKPAFEVYSSFIYNLQEMKQQLCLSTDE